MNEQKTQSLAEAELERKRREKRNWEKLLAYYMMQKWEEEQRRGPNRESIHPIDLFMEQIAQGRDLARLLFEKKPGQKSAYELLKDMDPYQEADSPFRKLLHTLQEKPEDKQEVQSAVEGCIRVAPGRILDRQRDLAADHPKNEKMRAEEERRLSAEMCLLRMLMPPDLYVKLCRQLTLQGRITDPKHDFLYAPEPEELVTYEQYTTQHRTEPQERDGKLANRDQVFTSAAYMMAAWEQRDAVKFDRKKADARAMELFNSRAFLVYMDKHPGSLLAAARNTGLEIISADLAALEAEHVRNNTLLRSARDTLLSAAPGKSAAFLRMTNALDRYISAGGEAAENADVGLKNQLAEYVLTEGDPRNGEYDRTCVFGAMRALKALMPEQDFHRFLEIVNGKRGPADRINVETLDTLPSRNELENENLRREAARENEVCFL